MSAMLAWSSPPRGMSWTFMLPYPVVVFAILLAQRPQPLPASTLPAKQVPDTITLLPAIERQQTTLPREQNGQAQQQSYPSPPKTPRQPGGGGGKTRKRLHP